MDARQFPDLKRLRAFEAVLGTGSLAAAAGHLRISQPAVSYLVKQFERDLGVALFDRGAQGSRLTAGGAALGARTSRFFDEIAKAITNLTGLERTSRRAERLLECLTSNQCRALLATWSCEDVGAAAVRLDVKPQAVVRAIRSLERLAATALLENGAERFRLTAAGREFSRGLSLAMQEVVSGLHVIGASHTAGVKSLRIGALVLSPRQILAEAVETAAAAAPRQTIEIVEGSYEELAIMLMAGSIDLIFGALRNPPPHAELDETRLHADPYVVACRRGHPLTKLSSIRPEHLADAQFVMPTAGLRQSVMAEFIRTWRLASPPQIHTSWLPSLIAILRSSDRLAILSKWHIDTDDAHDLQSLDLIGIPHDARFVGVTTRKSWLPTPFQDSFLESLRQVVVRRIPDSACPRDDAGDARHVDRADARILVAPARRRRAGA